MFASICRNEDSIEKQLAKRQLVIMGFNENSWFGKIRILMSKYNLGSALDILDSNESKAQWKKKVNKAVNEYWEDHIKNLARHYSTLKWMNSSNYKEGKIHSALSSVQTSCRDVGRTPVKLRILTGTYQLQSNKTVFNQNAVDPTCMLCNAASETLSHFLLECSELSDTRQPYLHELTTIVETLVLNVIFISILTLYLLAI